MTECKAAMNRRNAYLVTAALTLLSAGPTLSIPALAAPAIDHNREFQACLTLAEKHPAEALESAQTWLNHGGGDHARLCQALALFHKGDFTAAGTRLEELAPVLGKDDPKAGASILGRAGWAWLRAGDNARAERAYSRALALQPAAVDLLIDRAIARAEAERFWDAVADLDAALAKDPRRPEAYLYRAAAHKALANNRQAFADIDRALELRPGDPDALLLRANIKAQAGNLAGAREDWGQIVRNAPDSAAARTAQANLDRSAKAPSPSAKAPASKGEAKGGAAPAKP